MDYKLNLLLLLSFFFSLLHWGYGQNRIINGNDISIGEAPYIAALIYTKNKGHQCAGTLIATRVIASAAHCMDGSNPIQARVGSRDDLNGGQLIDIIRSIQHSKYNSYHDVDATYDYAVFILKEPVKLGPEVALAKLARRSVPEGTMLTLSGFGNGQFLKQAHIPIANQSNCMANYNYIPIPVDPHVSFCAGYFTNNVTSCFGDSGGPLVLGKNTLYGIVSWGDNDCQLPEFPAVYARVSTMASWFDGFVDEYK